MTENKPADQVQTGPWWGPLVTNVDVNPSKIEWPRDEHGTTSKLKKAFTEAAMSIKGNKQKEEVLIATIMVGLAHIRKRVVKDREVQEQRIVNIRKAAAARAPVERFK